MNLTYPKLSLRGVNVEAQSLGIAEHFAARLMEPLNHTCRAKKEQKKVVS